MNKNLFMILITISINISAGLNDTHWMAITRDIARDGDPKDHKEFEAARQAFLHIKDEANAKTAALSIEQKWKPSFGINATVGSKSEANSLMYLIRYPTMTKKQAKMATRKILKNSLVSQFLEEEGIKVIKA